MTEIEKVRFNMSKHVMGSDAWWAAYYELRKIKLKKQK